MSARRFSDPGTPSLRVARSVPATMGLVLLALLPGIAAMTVFFGPGVLWQIALAIAFALALEATMLVLRGAPLKPALTDLSAPLTAVLFALCLPPTAPWWMNLVGISAAIVVAKHLYGGLGHNPFNPAMVGVAVVVLAFPLEYSRWIAPGAWDTLAQATPLDALRQQVQRGYALSEIHADPVFGDFGGRGWEWVANVWALGGLFLLWKRVIPWQTPMALLATTVLLTLPFWLYDPDTHPSPLNHVFSGALVFAAFFIVTDPVSGCTTPRGRLLFGAGVAVLTLAIRRWGGFPDGVAFAVLLMNAAAPLIDRLARPRWLGEGPLTGTAATPAGEVEAPEHRDD
ncbi:MAG: RnfABCDGE type electron transport complex subunit D [Silanimonas sp.]